MAKILEEQCEWSAETVGDEEAWTVHLTDEEQRELDAALRHALAKSDDVLDIGREDFPLPSFAAHLAEVERELIDGRGFVRIRGIDRDAYSQDEMEMLYWGIGAHLGRPWPQNHKGHVLGDVTDHAVRANDPTTRGNEIGGIAFPFHCDGSDLVGLMCLANGIEGGLSTVSNSVVIHNRLVRERPEIAEALYGWFPYDFRGEQQDGAKPYYLLPVFTECDDRLFVRCIPPYIWSSQRHADAPKLTDVQIEAIRTLDEMANEPSNYVSMELRPGDIQFINNYHVLHGRTAYTDDRAAGQIRHLKRLWLETRVLASRPEYFANGNDHWLAKRSASRMRVGN